MQNVASFQTPDPIKIISLEIRLIKIGDYQRVIDKDKVKRIFDNFDIHSMRPIEVSFRDGNYWCVDGQNRLEVYKMRGEKHIPAQVHYGLTYSQECLRFARQHENEVKITTKQEWHALCEGGDRAARNILALCRKYNFDIGGNSNNGKEIGAIREVQKIYNRHGDRGLEDILFVLSKAFSNSAKSAHRDIVAGLGKILNTYDGIGDYEWNRFAEVLKKASPAIILDEANTAHGRGGKRVAKVIVRRYNMGLRIDSKRRLNVELIH